MKAYIGNGEEAKVKKAGGGGEETVTGNKNDTLL
jgi:hypothetical protein